jgi:DNA-binding transcriptional MocR family regulator
MMPDWEALYASRMRGVAASDIRERMKLLAAREIIHLGGGLPDPDIFPYQALADASAGIWRDPAKARVALQYAPSEGYGPLREWIANDLTRNGARCGIDNVMIVNGSQQGLDFVGKLLLSPGDRAMVEVPSFIGALRAFDAYQPTYVGLPQDPADWDPGRLGGAKFCYVGPDFRNPTGTTLTFDQRQKLLDLSDATGTPIVEDSCYERLRYDGEPIPSMIALGIARYGDVEHSPVIQTGTFSKTIAPSLRVGWIAGPANVIRKCVLIKQASDLATSALNQMLLLDVVESHLDIATRTACDLYRARRDSMLSALGDAMPEGFTWTRPEGGLYVWMETPGHLDGVVFAQRALAEHSVSVISGAAFYPAGSDIPVERNTVRLSFSMIAADRAREGIMRLGALAREMKDQAGTAALTAISTA